MARLPRVVRALSLDLAPVVLARGARQLLREALHARGRLPYRSCYSHADEEARIADLLAQLGPVASPVVVDLGAGDGVSWSNSLRLIQQGWRGVAVELDPDRFARLALSYRDVPQVTLVRAAVTPENVVPLLEACAVPPDFGVLSIDIDSYDHDVLAALWERFRPAVVCTEINEKFPPPIRFAVRWRPGQTYPGGNFYGHSLATATDLADRFDYALVGLELDNALFVPKEFGLPALTPAEAYQRGYVDRPERARWYSYNDARWLTLPPEALVADFAQRFAAQAGLFDLRAAP